MDPVERPDVILVVDDDEDIASFVAFNLKVHGYEVLVACDGQDALEVIEQRRPDLAVVDWMMPRMDGVELTQKLRADPLTSALVAVCNEDPGSGRGKGVGRGFPDTGARTGDERGLSIQTEHAFPMTAPRARCVYDCASGAFPLRLRPGRL